LNDTSSRAPAPSIPGEGPIREMARAYRSSCSVVPGRSLVWLLPRDVAESMPARWRGSCAHAVLTNCCGATVRRPRGMRSGRSIVPSHASRAANWPLHRHTCPRARMPQPDASAGGMCKGPGRRAATSGWRMPHAGYAPWRTVRHAHLRTSVSGARSHRPLPALSGPPVGTRGARAPVGAEHPCSVRGRVASPADQLTRWSIRPVVHFGEDHPSLDVFDLSFVTSCAACAICGTRAPCPS
jgi:hypothetical protein